MHVISLKFKEDDSLLDLCTAELNMLQRLGTIQKLQGAFVIKD